MYLGFLMLKSGMFKIYSFFYWFLNDFNVKLKKKSFK